MSVASVRTALHDVTAELAAFAAWWVHELREIWLFLAEKVSPARASRFLLQLEENGGVLRPLRADGAASAERRFEFDQGRALPTLSQLWPEEAQRSARVFVALPPSKVLICSLRLPPVGNQDLPGIVELQLERELPLPRELLYVDWQAEPRRAGQPRRVEVAITKRVDVDRLLADIQSWGWQVAGVGIAAGRDVPRFNLLPPRSHRLDFRMGKQDWRLTRVAIALSGIYLLTIGGQWWYERTSLAARLQDARAQVAKIEQQRSAIAERSKPVLALRELMTTPSGGQVLSDMTAAVPADSWVYEIEIRTPARADSSVKLEAYSPSAAALVDALERSPGFEQVQLVRTASAGVATGKDRVELTARLQGLPR